YGAPLCVDLMDVVAIPQRMGAILWHRPELGLARQLLSKVFRQPMSDVYAEPVNPAIGPEPQCVQEVLPHLGVLRVQIRLLGPEGVEVPLPVRHTRPRRSAEDRGPVRRRQFPIRA